MAPRIERLHFAAVALLVAFVELCATPAGVWGSPFGSVAAAKIWARPRAAAARARVHGLQED